jgi:hypothetical protein
MQCQHKRSHRTSEDRRLGTGLRLKKCDCRVGSVLRSLHCSDQPRQRDLCAGHKLMRRHGDMLISRKRRTITISSRSALHAG